MAEPIDGEELVDPTMPYGTVDEVPASRNESSRYSVQFIRAGGNAPVAVVNNTQVTVGDSIEGALVLEINRSYVALAINGQRTEVRLSDGVSKTRVDDL